jgi:FdhD protein
MAVQAVRATRVGRDGSVTDIVRDVPVEAAVAIVHDGSTHAVMMATPADLADFAIGFSLSEGVIDSAGAVATMEIVEQPLGWECRLWLVPDAARALVEHRRRIVGPTGCGLCGVDSLEMALRPARRITCGTTVTAAGILDAIRSIDPAQAMGRSTRATHAAALVDPVTGLVAIREDVGRHNALDKLIGHAVRAGIVTAARICVVTSRVSVEMVQKAAVLGTPILVAMSAPTALALSLAEDAGLTVCAVARDDGFEVFTHPGRITGVRE